MDVCPIRAIGKGSRRRRTFGGVTTALASCSAKTVRSGWLAFTNGQAVGLATVRRALSLRTTSFKYLR
jgi:hypothetical protein